MNLESRVWVYQSDRLLKESEVSNIQKKLDSFTISWTSHNHALKAKAQVFYNCFIIFIADESQVGASGCSIDKSVHFMQNLGIEFEIDFFNRLNFAYKEGELIKIAHKDDFTHLYENNVINDDTIVFNNLVKNYQELKEKWQVSLKESWHKNFV